MRDPMTLPPDALARATGDRWGAVRRWRPIDPDPSALVTVHRRLRGSRYRGLSRAVYGVDPAGDGFETNVVAQRISPETVRALYGDDLDAARRILDRSPIRPATPTPRPTLSPLLEAFAEGGRALLRDLGIRR